MTPLAELWTGRRVGLRPPSDQDLAWAYTETAHGRFGQTWRFGPGVPSRSAFSLMIQGNSDETFIAVVRDDPERRLGLLQLYDYDDRDRTGYIAFALTEAERMRAWPAEAVLLFVNYLFCTRPLRKSYFQGTDTALSTYRSVVGKFLVAEAHQVAHQYHDGRLEDVTTLSFDRQLWIEHQDLFARALRA